MSKYDPFKHHRRSIRLPDFDYTQAGAYFITICVKYGECLLGEVINDMMVLSEWGQIVEAAWWETAELREHVALDTHQVMPNHFHGLFWLLDTPSLVGAQRAAPYQRWADWASTSHQNHWGRWCGGSNRPSPIPSINSGTQ